MIRTRSIAAAALTAALSFQAHAEFTGKVIDVVDGDTITVLDAARQRHKIRLAGIDAPERGQAFGFRSKENLAKWIYEREAIVEADKKARGDILVAKVFVDGHDAGLEQIRAGLAWWNRPSASELSADDRELYELAEQRARGQKLRLWRDPRPVPPWEWRASRK